MTQRILVFALGIAVSFALVPAAWAYDETNAASDPSDCAVCHNAVSVSVSATGTGRQGPHGGYTTVGRACGSCHSVHDAESGGYVLLPGPTATEICSLCHDGTGGDGVYGAIAAQGLAVRSQHRTDTSKLIPGGDEAAGGSSTGSFSGLGTTLSCGDCHSVHGANTVEAFTSDRSRLTTDDTGFLSSKLLRRRPYGTTTETAVYGADWCAACHRGRVSGLHDVINHPVETSATAGFHYYEKLQVVSAANTTTTVSGSLGRSNFGYVMPWPRTAGQGSHKPICQQCHEDARSVGDSAKGEVSAGEVFSVAANNPQFQNFPHESSAQQFLIEQGDDLCTNCHHSGQLP